MGGDVEDSEGMVLGAARPDVIDEVIDGEAVVVHLGSGRYFAFNEAATALWTWFEPGRSSADLATLLGGAPAAWAGPARALVDAWVEEQLLAPVATDGEVHGRLSPITDGVPEMRAFTDLEDLLLLDPIHDVEIGADGFPIARQSS